MTSSSDDDGPNIRSRLGPKKKPYTPIFKEEWKKHQELAPWLCKGKTDIYFHCKFCFNDYLGGLSAIKQHSKSDKHRVNAKPISVSNSINKLPKLVQYTSNEEKLKKNRNKIGYVYIRTQYCSTDK